MRRAQTPAPSAARSCRCMRHAACVPGGGSQRPRQWPAAAAAHLILLGLRREDALEHELVVLPGVVDGPGIDRQQREQGGGGAGGSSRQQACQPGRGHRRPAALGLGRARGSPRLRVPGDVERDALLGQVERDARRWPRHGPHAQEDVDVAALHRLSRMLFRGAPSRPSGRRDHAAARRACRRRPWRVRGAIRAIMRRSRLAEMALRRAVTPPAPRMPLAGVDRMHGIPSQPASAGGGCAGRRLWGLHSFGAWSPAASWRWRGPCACALPPPRAAAAASARARATQRAAPAGSSDSATSGSGLRGGVCYGWANWAAQAVARHGQAQQEGAARVQACAGSRTCNQRLKHDSRHEATLGVHCSCWIARIVFHIPPQPVGWRSNRRLPDLWCRV